MYCGWEVKADMACLQVKLCVAVPKRSRKKTFGIQRRFPNVQVYFHFTLQTNGQMPAKTHSAFRLHRGGGTCSNDIIKHCRGHVD